MMPDLLISIIYNVNFDSNTTYESNNKVHAWIISLHRETSCRHRPKQYSIFWFHIWNSPNRVRNHEGLTGVLNFKLLIHVDVLIQREGSHFANNKQKKIPWVIFSCFLNFTTISKGFCAFSTNVLFHNVVSFRSIFNKQVTHISVKPEPETTLYWSKIFINTIGDFYANWNKKLLSFQVSCFGFFGRLCVWICYHNLIVTMFKYSLVKYCILKRNIWCPGAKCYAFIMIDSCKFPLNTPLTDRNAEIAVGLQRGLLG